MLARCMRSAVWMCIAAMKFCQSDALSPHSQGNLWRAGEARRHGVGGRAGRRHSRNGTNFKPPTQQPSHTEKQHGEPYTCCSTT